MPRGRKASKASRKGKARSVTPKLPSPPLNEPEPDPPSPRPSPPWDCEDASLPTNESDSQQDPDAFFSNLQSQKARSTHWDPWQDRFLVEVIHDLRPFLAPPGQIEAAWNEVARSLLERSSRQGPYSAINRTGSACSKHFQVLVQRHRAGEARSAQATGTVEQVNTYVKLLTDIVALLDDHKAELAAKSGNMKLRNSVEQEASAQLREASMKGLVRRESLVDVSSAPGASVREKQGQRGVKRRATSLSLDNKENMPGPLPHKRRHSELHVFLTEQISAEEKALQELRSIDDRRYEETLRLENQTLATLQNVQALLEGQQERELASRLQDTKQQLALTAAILGLSSSLEKLKS